MCVDESSDVEWLRVQAANLQMALLHRDVIGQAKGILMATLDCDADAAFDLLVDASQRTNRKLFQVAEDVARRELGAVTSTMPGAPRRLSL